MLQMSANTRQAFGPIGQLDANVRQEPTSLWAYRPVCCKCPPIPVSARNQQVFGPIGLFAANVRQYPTNFGPAAPFQCKCPPYLQGHAAAGVYISHKKIGGEGGPSPPGHVILMYHQLRSPARARLMRGYRRAATTRPKAAWPRFGSIPAAAAAKP